MAAPSALAYQDPFYAVREEITAKVDAIKVRHQRYLDLVKSTNTATNPTFKELRRGLKKEVEGAAYQTTELEKTITLVEADRARFRHIDNAELADRRSFISKTKQNLRAIKDSIDSEQVRSKMAHDEAEANRSSRGGDFGSGTEMRPRNRLEEENAAFIGNHKQRTQMMMKEQDEGLEELGKAVERVGVMAQDMNTELNTQARMLGDLERDVDETNERMNFVMGKLSQLLKTKDKCQLWTIVILVVILLILIILVIYA